MFPAVADTLGALHAKGLPLALVTNKPTPFVAPILASLDIAKYFTVVIGGDDVKTKTAPGTAASGRGETGAGTRGSAVRWRLAQRYSGREGRGLQLDRPDLRLQLRRADFAERAGLYL